MVGENQSFIAQDNPSRKRNEGRWGGGGRDRGATHPFLANDDALKTNKTFINVRSKLDHQLRWHVPDLSAHDIVDSQSIAIIPGSGLGRASYGDRLRRSDSRVVGLSS